MVNNINPAVSSAQIKTVVSTSSTVAVLSAQRTNPVFATDTVSLGNVELEYSTYSANPVSDAAKTELAVSYKNMSDEEIRAKLNEIKKAEAAADYTGMSDVEIYSAVEKRYSDAFGDDYWIDNAACLSAFKIGATIVSSRNQELNRQFGGNYNRIYAINRQRLFGDVLAADVISEIRSKYPLSLTNRDLFVMGKELESVGVADGMNGMLLMYQADALQNAGYREGNVVDANDNFTHFWESMLDKPANVSWMLTNYNANKASYNWTGGPDTDQLFTQIFNAHMGSDGFFEINIDKAFFGDKNK
jgi:hypothetical protein